MSHEYDDGTLAAELAAHNAGLRESSLFKAGPCMKCAQSYDDGWADAKSFF